MAVFVILSLAIAVVVLAVLVLAGVQLWRQVGRLLAAASAVNARLAPLAQELQSEIAVTGAESEALQRRVDAWQRERDERRQAKQGVRDGLRRSVRRG